MNPGLSSLPGRQPSTRQRHFLRAAVWLAVICMPSHVALALGLAADPVQGGFCSPPALGAPCAAGGLATMGNITPTPSFGIGNPVHLASGNKYQLDVDLPPNVSAPGLELVRHYNGLSVQAGVLGRNWTLSYDTQLQRNSGGWRLRQADGSVRDISAPLPLGNGFVRQEADGRQWQFDASGRLVRLVAGSTPPVQIQRHAGPHPFAGLIKRVQGAGGHALDFHYTTQAGQALLQAVDTPLGRFEYRYAAPEVASGHTLPRLVAMQRPDGMQRLYHYEPERQAGNPYALTGISVKPATGTAHRLATWGYDPFARVIRMQAQGREAPAMRLEYLQSARGDRVGITRVHSENGWQGELRFRRVGTEYRLLDRRLQAEADLAMASHLPVGAPVKYDDAGQLAAVGGLQLHRGPQGTLVGVTPAVPGWPGLHLSAEPRTGTHAWHSTATGTTTLRADRTHRPAELRHANGDTLQLNHDAQGRPLQIIHSSQSPLDTQHTRLQWRGRHLVRIEHPFETETRQYDDAGRITLRSVQRPAVLDSPAARFQEAFSYDRHGRLRRHGLPEGGALLYRWDDSAPARLSALIWEDAQGQTHTVVDSGKDLPGYRHGNGLEVRTAAVHGPHADTLLLFQDQKLLWRQQRRYDAAGRVSEDQHDFPLAGHHDHQRHVHDPQSRLQAALHRQPAGQTRWWYSWQPDGTLAAMRQDAHSQVPVIDRDASGLPMQMGHYLLEYGPDRRLRSITRAGAAHTIAQYRHNAFGHRITKRSGSETTHYLYAHDRLVAEARAPTPGSALQVVRRYLYAGLAPVGMIEYPPQGAPQLYAVHADLSGAPRLLTDARQRLRWLASYTPTGHAHKVAGDLEFPLRLPGQYHDTESGWHDNLLRTYAPELGHYLEPDPLGPLPGTDTFGYARQQPWRHADPHGLLLFAFDGTRYSADSMSNTWLLAQAYNDGAAHYHSGPGNSLFLDWDAVIAWNAGRILENQWQALLTSLERQPAGTAVPLDIIGFSRGAALARHFGNRVASHVNNGLFSVDDPLRGRVTACVDLRFMGLFDTVSQFGVAGSHNHLYDFGISELWSWVAHAVAMHEHRWTFPLTSANAGGAGNVVEAPFVGAHADIGGGLALLSPQTQADLSEDSDLAKVALGWMHWQAAAASVDFRQLSDTDTQLRAPRLRDMRSPLARTLQDGDRAVEAPSSATRHRYQNDDPRLGRSVREQVEAFIQRPADWRSQSSAVVGTVDMEGYARWLEDTLGWNASDGS